MRGFGVSARLGKKGQVGTLYVIGSALSAPKERLADGPVEIAVQRETWTDAFGRLGPCAIADAWIDGEKLKILVPLAVLPSVVAEEAFPENHPARQFCLRLQSRG